MQDLNPTFIGFLITCVFALSGFCVWLVKKVLNITKENTTAFQDFKGAIRELTTAVENNTSATKDLKTTLTLINK